MKAAQDVAFGYWGFGTGLLMFSFVSLIGIVFRVDPFAIAQRATCCAVVTAVLTKLTVSVVTMSLSGRK